MSVVHVTHDPDEAMSAGDRLVVLKDGVIQQCGPPREVFLQPATCFVARLVGRPPMNLIPGRLEGRDNDLVFVCDAGAWRLPQSKAAWAAHAGRDVILGIRPEHVMLRVAAGAPPANDTIPWTSVEMTAEYVEPIGADWHIVVRDRHLRLRGILREKGCQNVERSVTIRPGQKLQVAMMFEYSNLFDAASERALGAAG
jgi:multiple sugar transport system ATP-binding protein